MSDFIRTNLNKQGFGVLDDAAKSRYQWSLRFTPAVCVILIAVALVLRSPLGLGAMALVVLSGALFPRGMLIDVVYNLGVRHLFHAPPLPATPTPRRFSYLLSTAFLAGASVSFYLGAPTLGILLGGSVCIAGAVLATTLWCLGSWYFKLFFGPVAVEK